MSKMRVVAVAVASIAAASCSKQAAPAGPTPVDGAQVESVQSLPFEVPEGALFVVRRRGSTNLYRIRDTCRPLYSANPSRVVFYWTLEAGIKAGYHLSKDEGCR